MMLEVGKTAPLFTLAQSDGTNVALKTLRGRYVVIYFYPKDDTPGCTKEACGFRDLYPTLTKENIEVLGISPDDEASHRDFQSKYRLPFTLLCDPDRRVMEQYGAWGEKTLYGKKTTGVIRSTVIIDPNGVVVKHWRKVPKAEEHPQKVYEALMALMKKAT